MNIFICGSSFPDKVAGSKRKGKKNDAKTIPCTGKSKKVRKSCTVDKGSDEGKIKTAFLQ